jgi:outer membrane beta-barrel protein
LIRFGLAVAVALALYAGAAEKAYALQGGEDPALLPTLLDKRFGMGGRHHLSLFFSTSIVTKFVEGTGIQLGYQFMFTDIFGLELSGGYYFSDETNIMKEVRINFPGQDHPPLSDLFQMNWNASLDLVVVPFYGKLSFASEVDPSFDIYIVAGGGVIGAKRAEGPPDAPLPSTNKITYGFNGGVGLRIFDIDPWLILFSLAAPVGWVAYGILNAYDVLPAAGYNGIGLRIEVRDYFYPDPSEEHGGLTNHLLFQGGLQFTFGSYE